MWRMWKMVVNYSLCVRLRQVFSLVFVYSAVVCARDPSQKSPFHHPRWQYLPRLTFLKWWIASQTQNRSVFSSYRRPRGPQRRFVNSNGDNSAKRKETFVANTVASRNNNISQVVSDPENTWRVRTDRQTDRWGGDHKYLHKTTCHSDIF